MSSVDFFVNKTGKNYLSYRNLMVRISNLLGATNQTLETDIDDVLDFESKLANISRLYEKNGGAAYQRMSMAKLSKLVHKINWPVYFKYAIPVSLNESESVGIFGFDYFLDVQDIVTATSERYVISISVIIIYFFIIFYDYDE